MSVRSRREERKQETRAELVAAAASVFTRRGFQGASVKEIAREAGYTTGAVYWHFHGKDDLFLAVYEEQATARVRALEALRERATGDLPRRARAYADQFIARVREDPQFMILSLEFLVHAWRHPAARAAFSHRISWGRLVAARLLEDGARAAGYELPMSAGQLGAVLRELGVGLAIAKLADPEAIPDGLFGDFVELFFELLAEHEQRAAAGLRGTENAKPRGREGGS